MLVAAAVCPCPPLLVPEVATGAALELNPLREACSDALSVLAAARPDRLIVLGPAAAGTEGRYPSGAAGTFRGYGVDLTVHLGARPDGQQATATGHGVRSDGTRGAAAVTGHGARQEAPGPSDPAAPAAAHAAYDGGAGPEGAAEGLGRSAPERTAGGDGTQGADHWAASRQLPLSLTVGGWLLERAQWTAAPVEGVGVLEDLDTARCTALGRELADSADRVALLVTGDGSARRTLKAPGYLDERAAAFDAAVAQALGTADVAALTALDVPLARDLLACGRSAWQVLAGAAPGAALHGELLYDEAPYGVGYVVATWS
ncbi:class III extradiol dioxygenase subunit B-like domain-containing protein [Streptomyces sp. HSW2009]|uniref:class III extradiol dioxygenase subunit B-like domain-containing protein n=1 Tax=Streptomyces sp. HSW2009 TaxID=3142890 RepID=UPI0032EEE395